MYRIKKYNILCFLTGLLFSVYLASDIAIAPLPVHKSSILIGLSKSMLYSIVKALYTIKEVSC